MTYEEFKTVLRASSRAWHLELRDTYNVEAEDEPFRKFLTDTPDDYSWLAEWLDFIRDATASGISVQRLRLVTEPHTEYTRWGLRVACHNVEAGEDIRYLPRRRLADVDLPDEDCWLFDDDTLILSVFSEDGRQGGYAREDDPGLVERYRTLRDRIWPLGTAYADYVD